ncbi:hypothetical protein BX070DRAFT_225407 [Coemansia spiralis]|nr:hypothetical protein BX070DRAFT_225407 [Coemansia spiralis]
MCAQQSAQPIPIPITNFSSSHEGLVASSAPAMFHPSNNNNTQKPHLWSAMPHLYSGASPFGSGETSTPASLLSDTSTQGDAFSPCDLSPWGFAQNMEPPPTHKRRMTNESNDSTSSLPLLQNSSHDQANSNSMGPSYLGVSLPSNSFASTGPSSHLGVSLPSNPFAFSSMGQLDLFAQFGLSVEQPFANSGIAPEMTIQQQGGSSAGPTSNGGSRGGGALG